MKIPIASLLIALRFMQVRSFVTTTTIPGGHANLTHGETSRGVYRRISQPSGATMKRISTELRLSPIEIVQSSHVIVSTRPEDIEAEVCNDLAHLILDFVTILSPDTTLLRILVLCGRLLSILSDVLPDGQITVDEIIFQSIMLGISVNNIKKEFEPVLRRSRDHSPPTFAERKLYQKVFATAGFTWNQYMSLLDSRVFEWIHIPTNTIHLEDEDNILLTYSGVVEVKKQVYGRRNGRSYHDFIGNFLLVTDHVIGNKRRRRTNVNNTTATSQAKIKKLQPIRTGSAEASLLRINTHQFLEVVQQDKEIAECTKNLCILLLNHLASQNQNQTV